MLDFRNANEVFTVYGVFPEPSSGNVHPRVYGRFVIANGKLVLLEDHWNLRHILKDGPVEGENEKALQSLSESAYTRVVAEGEASEGKHLDLVKPRDFGGVPRHMRGHEPNDVPETESPPDVVENPEAVQGGEKIGTEIPAQTGQFTMQPPPPIFEYTRIGMGQPSIVEVHGTEVYMNGQKLSDEEAERLLETVRQGLATLRYRRQV